jgi:hypothetical protein
VEKLDCFVASLLAMTWLEFMAIDVSEDIARKGQELREMTRDLDLLKIDVDIIAIVIRFRGASAPTDAQGEDAMEGDPERESHRPAASD